MGLIPGNGFQKNEVTRCVLISQPPFPVLLWAFELYSWVLDDFDKDCGVLRPRNETKGSLAGLEVSLEPFSKPVLSRNFGHSLFAVSLTSPPYSSFKVSPAIPRSAVWDGGALAVKC